MANSIDSRRLQTTVQPISVAIAILAFAITGQSIDEHRTCPRDSVPEDISSQFGMILSNSIARRQEHIITVQFIIESATMARRSAV